MVKWSLEEEEEGGANFSCTKQLNSAKIERQMGNIAH